MDGPECTSFVWLRYELVQAEQAYGTSGVMPTSNELRQTGRRETINRQGEYAQIAEQLRLTMQHKRKPGKYWNNFAHVETELLAFIEEYGTLGVMPIEKELFQVGRGDLAKAIRKHNGIETVAKRLGLQLPSYKRKRHGYWDDFANITSELQNFIVEYGTSGVMPKQNELMQAGLSSLTNAIDHHGGIFAVAQRLGLGLSHAQHPDGYWDDFANIERELLAYIEKCGTQGAMPSRGELMKASLGDLAGAFDKYGGSSAVAERLGLRMKIKPTGHWDNFTNVERELLDFIAERGTSGVMPTSANLKDAERLDLGFAINKHGGFAKVASLLGLQLSYAKKPDGYWDDFDNVEQELLAFIQKQGIPGTMPTRTQLKDAGRSDLDSALNKHGGLVAVAESLSLEFSYTRKRLGYWNDFPNVRQTLLDFVEAYGTPGVMPTRSELQAAGRGDLIHAFDAHGGVAAVAKRLGFVYTVKPDGYWDDFANVKEALLQFIEEHGTPGVMPTQRELREVGQSALHAAIDRHGGLSAVAHSLGLHYSKEHITSHTATTVERIARSIQPLAESNLLSGAQVMIIQRRAGMLDYRNPRITRLNASLAHGNHDAIELALAQLRNAPDEETSGPLEDESALLQQDMTETGLEAVVGSDLPIEEERPFPPINSTHTAPDLYQEQIAIRGLSALGAIRLPLDEVLGLLTSKILWEAFYKRLYTWYGSLHATQTVTSDDVQAAILSAYAGQIDNEFVVQAAAKFIQEVEQAINFAMRLSHYGWTGPHLRLHQADAARRMADILMRKEHSPFLLDADDPGMGKSASFLAAVAASGFVASFCLPPKQSQMIRGLILVAKFAGALIMPRSLEGCERHWMQPLYDQEHPRSSSYFIMKNCSMTKW